MVFTDGYKLTIGRTILTCQFRISAMKKRKEEQMFSETLSELQYCYRHITFPL
jgi:hypothetical protein